MVSTTECSGYGQYYECEARPADWPQDCRYQGYYETGGYPGMLHPGHYVPPEGAATPYPEYPPQCQYEDHYMAYETFAAEGAFYGISAAWWHG